MFLTLEFFRFFSTIKICRHIAALILFIWPLSWRNYDVIMIIRGRDACFTLRASKFERNVVKEIWKQIWNAWKYRFQHIPNLIYQTIFDFFPKMSNFPGGQKNISIFKYPYLSYIAVKPVKQGFQNTFYFSSNSSVTVFIAKRRVLDFCLSDVTMTSQ